MTQTAATGQLNEIDLKLLGTLTDRRILELGSHAAVAFARAGASVIAVDSSAERLAEARALAIEHEVRIEVQEGDLAELARIRPESIEAVYSCFALQYVEDLGRLFRQVHRVLRTEAPFVFSVPHPWWGLLDTTDPQRPIVAASYFSRTVDSGEGPPRYRHSIEAIHTDLTRSNFRVDALIEPQPDSGGASPATTPLVPHALIVRARKVGL